MGEALIDPSWGGVARPQGRWTGQTGGAHPSAGRCVRANPRSESARGEPSVRHPPNRFDRALIAARAPCPMLRDACPCPGVVSRLASDMRRRPTALSSSNGIREVCVLPQRVLGWDGAHRLCAFYTQEWAGQLIDAV